LRFDLALGIVAGFTQALHVVVVIYATFSQRRDVITLCGQRDAPLPFALDTQW
jgi:hypothetical protein